MCQRFGPYSFVVNTDKVSRATAEDQGWDLWNDPANAGKYGILESDDWNVFNICLHRRLRSVQRAHRRRGGEVHRDREARLQGRQAGRRHRHHEPGAGLRRDRLPPDRRHLFSASPARADGYPNIRGITPKKGPMAGGKGGISWIEVTSIVNNPAAVAAGRRVPEICAGSGRRPHRRLRRRHVQPGGADGQPGLLQALHQGRARRHPVGQPRGGDGRLGRVRHRARLRQAARPHDRRQARGFRPADRSRSRAAPSPACRRGAADAALDTKRAPDGRSAPASSSSLQRLDQDASAASRAVDAIDLDIARGRVLHHRRAVGQRQDDAAAHARRHGDADRRATSSCAASASTTCRPTGARPAWCSSRWRCSRTSTVGENIEFSLKIKGVAPGRRARRGRWS